MGLEIVELTLLAEEKFEIKLKDEEMAFVSTCGQFCSLIERALGIDSSEKDARCASQRAFYQVRRELMDLTGKARVEITPRSSLQELIPSPSRAVQWNELSTKLELYLPELKRPSALITLFDGWALVSIFMVALSGFNSNYWAFAFVSIVLWVFTFHRTRPLATDLPSEMRTVGDIALRYAPRYAVLMPTIPTRDIWPEIQKMIADELSVPIERVTKDADFFRDLGAG